MSMTAPTNRQSGFASAIDAVKLLQSLVCEAERCEAVLRQPLPRRSAPVRPSRSQAARDV